MAARNEDWSLGLTLRAALMWCDEVIIFNHASTDGTAGILEEVLNEFPGQVFRIFHPHATWAEMAHRQEMLDAARSLGATHIAYIDADELITGNLLPSIREMIDILPSGAMLSLPWLQLRTNMECVPNMVMNTGMWAQQCASTAFKDLPQAHWAARNGYDFHQREPLGVGWRQANPFGRHRNGGLMHLQFLSERRLKAKQYKYQLDEVTRWPGRKPVSEIREMYSRTVRESQNASCATTPTEWWAPYAHLMHHLRIDAEPWQLQACREIIAANPGCEAGLNNFGLEL